MSNFDESKIKRQSAGTSQGGQFANKDHPANDEVGLGPVEPDQNPTRAKSRGRKSTYDKKAWLEKKQARARELQASISTQVMSLHKSENWAQYLKYASSFHNYSFNNVMLIMSQRPNATQVAGYRAWTEKGRQVRKGEKGIQIYGFSRVKVKDEDGNPELDKNGKPVTRTIYPVLTVFDVSQTDLVDPSKEHSSPTLLLQGDDEQELYPKAQNFLESEGWNVSRGETMPGVNGYTTLDGSRRVVVNEHLSEAQSAKTLIHESAHAILHSEEGFESYVEHRGAKETEAESVAYCVAGAYGMDTSDYSIGYVAGWSGGDEETIRASAERVLKASNTLLSHFDKQDESANLQADAA